MSKAIADELRLLIRSGWRLIVLETFEEDRALIPEGNLCELRYEELAADPMRAVQNVYDALSLGEAAQCIPIAQRVDESAAIARQQPEGYADA